MGPTGPIGKVLPVKVGAFSFGGTVRGSGDRRWRTTAPLDDLSTYSRSGCPSDPWIGSTDGGEPGVTGSDDSRRTPVGVKGGFRLCHSPGQIGQHIKLDVVVEVS